MIWLDSIPLPVLTCIRRLEKAGFETWLVGGAVRDLLRGQLSSDWDLATAATPSQTAEVFNTDKLIPIGLQHGTVRVVWPETSVDITTYRVDGDYTDSRHPDTVSYTSSIRDDLSRRDFTINAMAYHPERGLIDPFNGFNDLKDKLIRAVGDADTRINEDVLRIMRALRFVSVLGYSLETSLLHAMYKASAKLDSVPQERLGIEWTALLFGYHAAMVLGHYFPILRPSLLTTEDSRPYQAWRAVVKLKEGDVCRHVAFSLAMNLDDRWFSNLVLRADERQSGKIIRRLVNERHIAEDTPLAEWRWHAVSIGYDTLSSYVTVCMALTDTDQAWLNLQHHINEWKNSKINSLADLAVNGHDLMKAGLPPAAIGKALKRLFLSVAADEMANQAENLLDAVKVWYNC